MSKYIETIAEALIDVLNGAASSKDHRIVGYAANFDFWTSEIAHCVAAIDDFPNRQEMFVDAVKRTVDEIRAAELQRGLHLASTYDPTRLLYGESPTSIQTENYVDKTARLRVRLLEAARKFVGRMRNEGLISVEKLETVKAQLPFL